MTSKNFCSDNPDLMFHLTKAMDFDLIFKWLSKEQIDVLEAKNGEEFRQSWIQVIETFGEICGTTIASNAHKVESEGLTLQDGEVVLGETLKANIKTLIDFGVAGLSIAPRYGGMGAPFLFDMLGVELLNRACPSTMLNVSWYGPIAHMIDEYGTQELKDRFIPLIASGEKSGNMALTEADAGSDLAALRTYCEKQEDGSYKIFGAKRFITNGNGEISLVLAKSKKGAVGLDYLNLLVCPRILDGKHNYEISKIEEKAALSGSATCELYYEGSKAWLLGEEGMGYRYMLKLMNESRIGVGFQGLGLMQASFELAKEYAQLRTTWGKPIAEHEQIAEKLLDLEVEINGLRSLSYKAAFYKSLSYLGSTKLKEQDLSEKERKEISKLIASYDNKVREITPLIKYWTGENSYRHAREAMQVMGGYGFITESRAEWWLRESLIYSLYEGTSEIQALMVIKDTFKKVISKPKRFADSFISCSIKRFTEKDPLARKIETLKFYSLQSTAAILLKLTKVNFQDSMPEHLQKDLLKDLLKSLVTMKDELLKFKNQKPALLHAARLCELKSLEAMAKSLYEDAKIDSSRRWIAERFINTAVHKAAYLKGCISSEEPVLNNKIGINSWRISAHD